MIFSEKAAQGQLEAYNNRDIVNFMKWYASGVKAIDIDRDVILFEGLEDMEKRYEKLFENEHLQCQLLNRMVLNHTVIDHEKIIHNGEGDTFYAIAIYHVNEKGLIESIRFTKGQSV